MMLAVKQALMQLGGAGQARLELSPSETAIDMPFFHDVSQPAL